MPEEEAIELAADAIQAGIFYDLGSGSNINIFAYNSKEQKVKKLMNYRVFNNKEYEDKDLFKFPTGTATVLERDDYKWRNIKIENEEVKVNMDI